MAPWSRHQASLVGMTWNTTAGLSANGPSRLRTWASWSESRTLMRTVSPFASALTAATMAVSASGRQPGQVSGLCGHEIQVAWCGAHSAGMA